MEDSLRRPVIVLSALLLMLMAAGNFIPSSLTWGFHLLAFLPGPFFFLYLMLGMSILLLSLRWQPEDMLTAVASFMERKTGFFLAIIVLLFFLAALLFHVRASVWGDGITLVKDIVDHAEGSFPLDPWSEPFSIYFLSWAITTLGPLDFPHITVSFVIVQLVLGGLVIMGLYLIAKNLIADPLHRLLTLLLLLVLPCMEFFFGYIETYPPAVATLVLFLLLSLLVLKGKAPFALIPPLYVILTFTHYINGLYGPSVIYLAYRQYREGRRAGVLVGFSAAAALLIVILTVVSFRSERLIDLSPVSHFLSLTGDMSPVNAYSQAYTVLSIYHVIDLLNYVVMMAPFAIMIVVFLALRRGRALLVQDPVAVWCASALVPLFGFLLVAKLEQGTANDWDVFAAHFITLSLFASHLFWKWVSRDAVKTFVLILLISTLQSVIWFSANATTDQNIRRFQTMWDKRMLSHLGNYTMALRLTRYYDATNDTLKEIDTWEKYASIYPEDPRGYDNEIACIGLYAPGDYQRQAMAYRRWLQIDPANDSLKRVAASVCLSAGNLCFSGGSLDSAAAFYTMAISDDSTLAKAYNNLGSIFARTGQFEKAKPLFARAIAIDSGYSDAYYNLGNALDDTGDPERGKRNLIASARLGNENAREVLRKRGIRW